jgi:hypothetical protein
MSRTKTDQYIVIERIEDIPRFQSEAEEADFWATHDLSEDLMARAEPIPDAELPSPRRPSIRLDPATEARMTAVAGRLAVGVEELMRTFILERLYEEEVRAGLVRPKGRRRGRAAAKST